MNLQEYTYNLPEELIAQYPLTDRDNARLLVLDRKTGRIEHRIFFEILDFLHAGDVLVLNNTKVFKARLKGIKDSGGSVEVLLVKKAEDNLWEGMVSHSRRVRADTKITFGTDIYATVKNKRGTRCVLGFNVSVSELIKKYGFIPLPHYIKRPAELTDEEFYQTVFAKEEGSIAAPTAGLHFTQGLLKKIGEKGVIITEITLHIGPGTFKPIRTKNVEEYKMESEYLEISKETAEVINRGKRIIGVGTSVTRALESVASYVIAKDEALTQSHKINNNVTIGFTTHKKRIKEFSGFVDLFIYPGYRFKIIDGLITNLHLPCSTPLLLVCAFASNNLTFKVYKEAIEKKYHFLSYGDAMLIL